MDVRPAGTGATGAANLNPATARVSPISQPAAVQPVAVSLAASDSIALLLKELSPPDISKLLQILESPARPESGQVLATTVQAASEHDIPAVLTAVQKLVSRDPQLADTLRSHPGLSTVRPEIDQLLNRLSSVAKWSAEEKLIQAQKLADVHAISKLPDWDTPPETLLRLGRTLMDAGGLGNYAKAEDMAQVMIDALHFLPIPDEVRIAASIESRQNSQANVGRLRLHWIVIPLLILAALLLTLLFHRLSF